MRFPKSYPKPAVPLKSHDERHDYCLRCEVAIVVTAKQMYSGNLYCDPCRDLERREKLTTYVSTEITKPDTDHVGYAFRRLVQDANLGCRNCHSTANLNAHHRFDPLQGSQFCVVCVSCKISAAINMDLRVLTTTRPGDAVHILQDVVLKFKRQGWVRPMEER